MTLVTLEQDQIQTHQRNYGVDLLRVVSMLMVLLLHILGNGGILFEAEPTSPQGIVGWFFEMAVFSAINCYGIISGYVGVNSKYKYSNYILLWLQVALYSGGITLIYHLRYPLIVSSANVHSAFFPVCNQKYWYFTAYTGLFFIMPLLNAALKNLTKKQLSAALISMFLLFSVLPVIYVQDIFLTGWGYSMLWLAFLYLIGAYIKLYGLFSKKTALILYLICTLIAWGAKVHEEAISTADKYADISIGSIARYTSPFILLAGICIFILFYQLKPKGFLLRFVKLAAPCSFGVYLIHTHPMLWARFITYRYAHYTKYNPIIMMFLVFITAAVMFTAFGAVDLIRNKVFSILRLKHILQNLENKISKGLWQE